MKDIVLKITVENVEKVIKTTVLKWYYYHKYGDLAPNPNETFYIDPNDINYSIANKYLPENAPPFGILNGNWDLNKTYWLDSPYWDGLRERFEDGLPWEETKYYRRCVDKIEAGEPLGVLDDEPTVEKLEEYLDELDNLYLSIKNNGYDYDCVITISIGRNGEMMVNHGNHRRVIARILDVDSVPVNVRYRHEKWQKKREELCTVNNLDHRDHPDINPNRTR